MYLRSVHEFEKSLLRKNHFSSRTICTDGILELVKKSTKSMVASYPCPAKLSVSPPSTSPSFAAPLPSQSYLHAASSAPSRWRLPSQGQQLSWQVSESQVPSFKSPNGISISEERPMHPLWNNDSVRGSRGGSSDGWSINAFSELMGTSRRDKWSFDSESFGCTRDKITRCSSRISASVESQTCGVCLKLFFGEICMEQPEDYCQQQALESITPEVDKYDPPCPVCTHGEKQTLKLSEKVLEAALDIKAKNISMKHRVVDSHLHGDSLVFVRPKDWMNEVNCTKMSSSSGTKGSLRKPFLKLAFLIRIKGKKILIRGSSNKKEKESG